MSATCQFNLVWWVTLTIGDTCGPQKYIYRNGMGVI